MSATRLRAYFTSFFIIAWTFVLSSIAIATMPLSPRGDLFLWIAKRWSRSIFWAGGIRIDAEINPEVDPQANYLYLSTHESLTDILALFAALSQKVVMVAKRSILIIPVFSWGMWLAGFVFINRKDRESAYRSMAEAGRKLRRGRSVLVFPEGTRGDGGPIKKLKRGGFVLAQQVKIPVVPVAIAGTQEVLPRDTFPVYPGHIAVCVGKPIPPPTEDEPLEPYMERLRVELEALREQARALRKRKMAENAKGAPTG